MSAFMAAFKVLIACSTMLRNELYGGSFLSSEFDQEWQDCSELVRRRKWKSHVHLGRGLALPVTENHYIFVHSFQREIPSEKGVH